MGISTLPTAAFTSLSDQVAQALRDAILRGDLQAGERLIESDVARRMGVSRAPVREAILTLRKEGLVRSGSRTGTFVAPCSRKDLDEIYAVRMGLEGQAARLAAACITPEECAELASIIDALASDKSPPSVEETIELDLRFHQVLAAASRNSRIIALVADLGLEIALYIARTRPNPPSSLRQEHEAVLRAVQSGDAELAERRMREHLQRSRKLIAGRMP